MNNRPLTRISHRVLQISRRRFDFTRGFLKEWNNNVYSRLTTARTQDDSRDGGGRECLEPILKVERRRTPKPRKISCGIKDQVRSALS